MRDRERQRDRSEDWMRPDRYSLNRNNEGYSDSTAYLTIRNAEKLHTGRTGPVPSWH